MLSAAPLTSGAAQAAPAPTGTDTVTTTQIQYGDFIVKDDIQEQAVERLSWAPPRAACIQTEDVHDLANGNDDGTTSSQAWIE